MSFIYEKNRLLDLMDLLIQYTEVYLSIIWSSYLRCTSLISAMFYFVPVSSSFISNNLSFDREIYILSIYIVSIFKNV